MNTWQVLFKGELVPGFEAAAVRASVARLLRVDGRKISQLFSGRTVVVGNRLEEHEAIELQQRLFEVGARCRVKERVAESAPAGGRFLDHDVARMEQKPDQTLRDITAAWIDCPRCGHFQLETTNCGRCGVEMALAAIERLREDRLIEKKIRELRAVREAAPGPIVPKETAKARPRGRPGFLRRPIVPSRTR
jgi:hypothetical protein